MASVIRGSGASTLGGALDVQGVLTYEDVTSVDSIGIITARSGIIVGTGASIFSPDTNELTLGTNNVERLRIESGGNITATSRVDVGGLTADSNLTPTSGTSIEIFYGGSGGVIQTFDRDNSNTEPLRVRGSNWDIGYTGSASFAGGAFAIESDGDISTNVRGHGHIELDSTGAFTSPKIKLFSNTGAATFAGSVNLALLRVVASGTTYPRIIGTPDGTLYSESSSLVYPWQLNPNGSATFTGEINVGGYNGSSTTTDGVILGAVGGVYSQLAASSASSGVLWQGMHGSTFTSRIQASGSATFLGNVFVGKSADVFADVGIRFPSYGAGEFTRNQGALLALNRLTTDGDLIDFYRNGVSQGNIRVNSGTVSLNGAHLSRWSQLPGGADRTEILRGSILSNLDEMCEWGEEDNEQLNRMKVSDVEGDRNISGVFESWDDEDDTYTNDFYCAMTGDFVIRIAQGTTVARGDLLMSAGDGTSKPQDDDIIRSKTIAKVTSTNVSETYADGSYCVPCVLMAC